MTSNVQLRHLQTSAKEIEEGAVLAYLHISEMFNRSDPEEFSNSLAIIDKNLAERFARYLLVSCDVISALAAYFFYVARQLTC